MKKDKSKLYVMNKRCNQCLFSKNKIVSEGRKEEVIKQALAKGTYFNCHKDNNICCRGFFDKYKNHLPVIILGQSLKRIFYV